MKYFLLIGLLMLPITAHSALVDISHTPLVNGALRPTDKVPMGRPSDGAENLKGVAYTVSIDQISSYIQSAIGTAGIPFLPSDPSNSSDSIWINTTTNQIKYKVNGNTYYISAILQNEVIPNPIGLAVYTDGSGNVYVDNNGYVYTNQ